MTACAMCLLARHDRCEGGGCCYAVGGEGQPCGCERPAVTDVVELMANLEDSMERVRAAWLARGGPADA